MPTPFTMKVPSADKQIPNSAPKPKAEDAGKDKDSIKSSKSGGKRKSTVSEIEVAPLLDGDVGSPESTSKAWRESQLGKKVRGMETEEDMIKQRDEIKGLIEKKTYIGLVS